MKKPKNKHGKQFSKLIPEIRKLIKKYAHHHAPIATLLRLGLSSILSNNNMDNTYRDFSEIFNEETRKLQNKYKKINIEKMYWQIRVGDIQNYALHNYSIDPRDTSYIDENGKKIIRF